MVTESFPHPVAAAWHRALSRTSDSERLKHGLATFEVLLRTLGAALLLDYLRGVRTPAVDALLKQLDKPSLGHWVGLIRETARALNDRASEEVFFGPAGAWYFTTRGKPTEIANRIDALVTISNQDVHERPPPQARRRARADHVFRAARPSSPMAGPNFESEVSSDAAAETQFGQPPFAGKDSAIQSPQLGALAATCRLTPAIWHRPRGNKLEVTPFIRVSTMTAFRSACFC